MTHRTETLEKPRKFVLDFKDMIEKANWSDMNYSYC